MDESVGDKKKCEENFHSKHRTGAIFVRESNVSIATFFGEALHLARVARGADYYYGFRLLPRRHATNPSAARPAPIKAMLAGSGTVARGPPAHAGAAETMSKPTAAKTLRMKYSLC